jgi:uncharacterized membrane protein
VGAGLSAYLTYVHYTEPGSLSCPATSAINCTKVTTSTQSMLFGVVPVAVAGIAYFVLMGAIVGPWAWRSHARRLDLLRTTGAAGGVAMVCYLVYVEVLVVRAVCLWCTAVHVAAFVLFVAVLSAVLLRMPDEGSMPRR